jgi:hypothetical protein
MRNMVPLLFLFQIAVFLSLLIYCPCHLLEHGPAQQEMFIRTCTFICSLILGMVMRVTFEIHYSNFWQKRPPPRVNCQKEPHSSEIDKNDHLRHGGKLAKRHVAHAATAQVVFFLPILLRGGPF